MHKKGILWKLLVQIILLLVIVVLFSAYKSCTSKKVTVIETDGRRIGMDLSNLQEGETMFVPIIGGNYKAVLYPFDEATKPSMCKKDSCVCMFPKESSSPEYCHDLAFGKDCSTICVDTFQRVDVSNERWLVIKRVSNRLIIEKPMGIQE